MFLIVGLGNPEKKYDKTRHNIGFDTIDALADKYNILQGTWGGIPVIGMNHPSARVSNDYFDTVFKHVVSLTK